MAECSICLIVPELIHHGLEKGRAEPADRDAGTENREEERVGREGEAELSDGMVGGSGANQGPAWDLAPC